jgi:SAM-dependent methyltransferase
MPIARRAAALSALFAGLLIAQQDAPSRYPDVPYVPTPAEVVEQMLKLADVHEGDVVYDLGCGDGRIVIMAATRFGARATGVDIDPALIRDARENAKKAGVSEKVKFVEGDLFATDLRSASVVTLYLLPGVNVKLIPKLLDELKPGSRVVSFRFDMGDWKATKKGDVNGRPIYLWVIPEKPR